MSAIGPGDWVEYVGPARFGMNPLDVVRVAAFRHDVGRCDMNRDCVEPGLIIDGRPLPEYLAWCACSFRPIYRPKADLIEGLKAGKFECEEAPADAFSISIEAVRT